MQEKLDKHPLNSGVIQDNQIKRMKDYVDGVHSNINSDEAGLQLNRGLQTLDLSDNELTDEHAHILCQLIRVRGDARDSDRWEFSLRQREAEKVTKILDQVEADDKEDKELKQNKDGIME